MKKFLQRSQMGLNLNRSQVDRSSTKELKFKPCECIGLTILDRWRTAPNKPLYYSNEPQWSKIYMDPVLENASSMKFYCYNIVFNGANFTWTNLWNGHYRTIMEQVKMDL